MEKKLTIMILLMMAAGFATVTMDSMPEQSGEIMTTAMAISAIPVQIFETYIVEKLRKVNPFMVHCVDETASVLGGSVVHIPNAGASPTVVKNRTTFPATAVQRADTHVTYGLDVFSTTPTHVTWQEENEISYDKTDSVLADHVATLTEAVGDDMIYNWLKGKNAQGNDETIPEANIVYTTGDPRAASETGQTGQRKKVTAADVRTLQTMMNKMNVPKEGRYLMMESEMYAELMDSLSSNQMAAYQQTADVANGVLGKLYGFNIMERSTVTHFNAHADASGTAGQPGYVAAVPAAPIAPGTALNATDNVACIAWQKDSVAKALGDIKPFQSMDDPMYYGDVFSAAVKAGGRCRRADWAGVLALVQGTPSE